MVVADLKAGREDIVAVAAKADEGGDRDGKQSILLVSCGSAGSSSGDFSDEGKI